MKYQAILFDMDGVVVNSEPLHKQAFEDVFKHYDIKLTDDDFKMHFVGKTDERGLEGYSAHSNLQLDTAEFIEKKVKTYHKLASKSLVAYPGLVELVRELSNQVPLALVTGSLRTETDLVLNTLDIDDCFDIIVTADDVEEGKPSPEGYLRAVGLLSKDPEECVVIEDSPAGVSAANEAGIHCIAVTNTHTEAELGHADLIVDKLEIDLFQ